MAAKGRELPRAGFTRAEVIAAQPARLHSCRLAPPTGAAPVAPRPNREEPPMIRRLSRLMIREYGLLA
jgi:hypothetical protein